MYFTQSFSFSIHKHSWNATEILVDSYSPIAHYHWIQTTSDWNNVWQLCSPICHQHWLHSTHSSINPCPPASPVTMITAKHTLKCKYLHLAHLINWPHHMIINNPITEELICITIHLSLHTNESRVGRHGKVGIHAGLILTNEICGHF